MSPRRGGADALVSRLDGVRRTGSARWLARCPAHEDRRPSLSIRELDDGRVLVHCFAGCEVESILGAVGLEFDALFPDREVGDREQRQRRPFNARDVLEAVTFEALVAAVAAENIAMGVQLAESDHARLMLAAERLQTAKRMCSGD
jgi:hypothetical protein